MLSLILLIQTLLISTTKSLYNHKQFVTLITSQNIEELIVKTKEIWMIDFFDDHSDKCKKFAYQFNTAANHMHGIVKFGAVDSRKEKELVKKYNVVAYPTVKIFNMNRLVPDDYQRHTMDATALINASMTHIQERIRVKKGLNHHHVYELTDDNFDKLVYKTNHSWLIMFGDRVSFFDYGTKWAYIASRVGAHIKVAQIDLTFNDEMRHRFNIDLEELPEIKLLVDADQMKIVVEYPKHTVENDIARWAILNEKKHCSMPDIKQLTNESVFQEFCLDKEECVVVFVPHIMECLTGCRLDYLDLIKIMAKRFKGERWGWIWLEVETQLELEATFGITDLTHIPTLIFLNPKKKLFTNYKSSFSEKGLYDFLHAASKTPLGGEQIRSKNWPFILEIEPWDYTDPLTPESTEPDYDPNQER